MDAIDPFQIPPALTRLQLEDWILFGILVANKEAAQTRRKLDLLLGSLHSAYPEAKGPFELIRYSAAAGTLLANLKLIRSGQYTRIERAFREVIELDLDHITVKALETVHGIGPKTARMVLLYHLPNLEVVPLDTHILKYLSKLGYEDVPNSTPPAGKKYRYWESVFVAEAKKAGITVREFDTKVWQMYAKRSS